MGRGRAKAKQTKVARQLKYSSGGTDLDRLQAELAAERGDAGVSDDGDEDDGDGYSGYLDTGEYFSDPGAKWNNNTIQDALHLRYGSELLFPVYDTLVDSGSNAAYHIIGWATFHVSSVTASGSDGAISGYFTKAIWPGRIDPPNGGGGPPVPDLGVHSIALVD